MFTDLLFQPAYVSHALTIMARMDLGVQCPLLGEASPSLSLKPQEAAAGVPAPLSHHTFALCPALSANYIPFCCAALLSLKPLGGSSGNAPTPQPPYPLPSALTCLQTANPFAVLLSCPTGSQQGQCPDLLSPHTSALPCPQTANSFAVLLSSHREPAAATP